MITASLEVIIIGEWNKVLIVFCTLWELDKVFDFLSSFSPCMTMSLTPSSVFILRLGSDLSWSEFSANKDIEGVIGFALSPSVVCDL